MTKSSKNIESKNLRLRSLVALLRSLLLLPWSTLSQQSMTWPSTIRRWSETWVYWVQLVSSGGNTVKDKSSCTRAISISTLGSTRTMTSSNLILWCSNTVNKRWPNSRHFSRLNSKLNNKWFNKNNKNSKDNKHKNNNSSCINNKLILHSRTLDIKLMVRRNYFLISLLSMEKKIPLTTKSSLDLLLSLF